MQPPLQQSSALPQAPPFGRQHFFSSKRMARPNLRGAMTPLLPLPSRPPWQGGGLIRIVRAHWKGHVSITKTGVIRSVPLVAKLAATLRAHRARVVAGQHPGLREGWIFARGGWTHAERVRPPELPAAAIEGRLKE